MALATRDNWSFSLVLLLFMIPCYKFNSYTQKTFPSWPRVTHHLAFSVWVLSWLPRQSSSLQQNVSLPRDCLQTPGLLGMVVLPASQIHLQVQRIHSILKWQVLLLWFWRVNLSITSPQFVTIQNNSLFKILKEVGDIIPYEVILWRHYGKGGKARHTSSTFMLI